MAATLQSCRKQQLHLVNATLYEINVHVSFILFVAVFLFLICKFLLILEIYISNKNEEFTPMECLHIFKKPYNKINWVSTGGAQELLPFILWRFEQKLFYSTLNPTPWFERLEALRVSSDPQIRIGSINGKGLFVKVSSSCAFCAEH